MSKWPYRRAESTGNFDRTRALPRTRRYGRRTVEQTRSVDIRDLRKAAYVGEAEGNWLDARNKLFCAGVQPKHWNDAAITLDGQMLPVTWVGWHFGGRRPFFVCLCGRRVLQLFAPRSYSWRCRQCYNLSYATRQAGIRYRLILKGQKVRERLGVISVSRTLSLRSQKECIGDDIIGFAPGTIRRCSKASCC